MKKTSIAKNKKTEIKKKVNSAKPKIISKKIKKSTNSIKSKASKKTKKITKSKKIIDTKKPEKKLVTPKKKVIKKKTSSPEKTKKITKPKKTNQEPELSQEQLLFLQQEIEKENRIHKYKQSIMWAGVCSVMLIIVFVWFFNFKTIFKNIEKTENNNFSWNEISNNLNQTIDNAKKEFKKIKQDVSSEEWQAVDIVSMTTSTPEIASSSIASSTNATSTENILNDDLTSSSTMQDLPLASSSDLEIILSEEIEEQLEDTDDMNFTPEEFAEFKERLKEIERKLKN